MEYWTFSLPWWWCRECNHNTDSLLSFFSRFLRCCFPLSNPFLPVSPLYWATSIFFIFVVAVVLFVHLCALITIQRVNAARPPAISPSDSPAGVAVFSATLFPTPGVWLPVNVVEFCPPHLTYQKPDFSALVVFFLFCSNLLS